MLNAVATFGTWYETAFSRASGSPETSLFNSLVNAFVAYAALRGTRRGGLFLTPAMAFDALGIYGGDDGLTADVDAKVYVKAASRIGQELTVEPVKRGNMGVKFLARVYSPDVWFGDMNSCCDLPRQLCKIHVSVPMSNTVSPTVKLLEKVRSFSLSDEHTPILGLLCATVIDLHGGPILPDANTTPMRHWLGHFDKEVQYVNEPASWMMDYAVSALPDFDWKTFHNWMAEVKTFTDVLAAPLCMEPIAAKSAVPVVVDGEVLPRGEKFKPKVDRPPRVARKETFESFKARKIASGTWQERGPKPPRGPK